MKKNLIAILILLLFTTYSYPAGSGGGESGGSGSSGSSGSDLKPIIKSNFYQAVDVIKWAKKFEKKGKLDKAKKRYEKALKLLIKSNKSKPNKADTLNYLGFTTRKLGDFEGGEKYYLEGLAIEPNHIDFLSFQLNVEWLQKYLQQYISQEQQLYLFVLLDDHL